MNVFEAVKQSVTTRQAAEHYGIHVNRNGMCVCPFHNDKNPSMKVDRRFYCFGCGATGDVIDFVSRLHGIGSREAALMLAQDFSIPYEDGRNAGKQPIRPRLHRETEEQKFKRMERHCYRVLSDYYHLLRRWKEEYAPKQPDEAWNPRFIEALQNMSRLEYLMDVLLSGELPERAALITGHGKEVRNLERRMAELTARDDDEITCYLRPLHEMVITGNSDFGKEENLLFLISELVQKYGQPFESCVPECPQEIEKACEFIRQHFNERIYLDQICRYAGLSKSTLLRAFTKIKGITPYRYLETIRINEAKVLLGKGMQPVEAAMQTGFSDQSHFTNYFTRFIGLAPGVYRDIFFDRKGDGEEQNGA